MAFCAKCGAQVKDTHKFCATCGAAVGVTVTSEEKTEQPVKEIPAVEQTVVPVSPEQVSPVPPTPKKKDPNKPIGVGAVFGLILLYMIPIIGFAACIIMSFTVKNNNVKNLSRGFLIYLIISAIVTGIIMIIINIIITSVFTSLQAYVTSLPTVGVGNFLQAIFSLIYFIGQLLGYYPG